MKYNYKFNFLRFVLLLGLLGLFSLQNAQSQGLLNNTTYIINGGNDLVAPVDTFTNLTGPNVYPSYGAMTYLNQYGMNSTQTQVGQVTFLLSSGYNPVEPNVITIGNANATPNIGWPNMFYNQNSPIVLKPDAGQNFNITTSTFISGNQSLVRMNNAWFFTIDGQGTTGQRNLTFSMPNGSSANQTSSRVIDMIPTASQKIQFLAVKNCIIVGNSSLSTAIPLFVNTYAGVYIGGPSTGLNAANGKNQNITITNNLIVACQNGVYYRGLGNSAGNQDKNITISDNTIGDYVNPVYPSNTAFIGGGVNSSGIYVSSVINAIIDNNIIRNSIGNSQGMRGISLNNDAGSLALDSNVQVTRNRIYNMTNTVNAGVYGIRISLGTHGQHLRLLVANNSISALTATVAQSTITSYSYPIGILVEDASSMVGLEVFFNSINLTGSTLPPNALSACFVTSTNTNGGIIMMNNSFANSMGKLPTNVLGYTNYNVLVAGNTYPFRYSSFNNYYTTTFDGGNAYMGRGNNKDYTSLKGFRSYSRSDSTSFSTIPPFKNDTDLTVNNGVSHHNFNRGVNLFQFYTFYQSIYDSIRFKVNIDVFGTSRNGMGRFTPIGFHKWNGDSTNNPQPIIGTRTYAINGVNIKPTPLINGSFASVAFAIDYINHYGVGGSGAVYLQLAPGYGGETTFTPAFIDYPGSSIGIPIIFNTASGFSTIISAPNVPAVNNAGIVRFMGASNIIFDGGLNKSISFVMPDTNVNVISRVIAITPVDTASTNITIKNCNIIGNSKPINGASTNPNTAMGIYVGNPAAVAGTGNPTVALTRGISNISFLGNNIQAVRSGIAFIAPGGASTAIIKNNIIGGTIPPVTNSPTERTTYIGGAAGQAGIWVRGLIDCIIDSNVVRNSVPGGSLSNAFAGIFLDEQINSSIFNGANVTRNFAYQLVTTSGTYCVGLRVGLNNSDTARNITIINNFIGSIVGNGASVNFNTQNPAGILLDAPFSASTPLVNVGISLAHNTVNLTGVGLANTNSGSAALFIGSAIRGGVASINNIFVNRLSRNTALNPNTTGKRYAVLIGSPVSPFTSLNIFPFASNINNYYSEGNGQVPTVFNNLIGGYNGVSGNVIDRLSITDWRLFVGLAPAPANNDASSFSWSSTFKTDTTPDVVLINGGPVPGSAAFVAIICNDIYGNARFGCSGGSTSVTRWVGAAEAGLPYPALQGNIVYKINGTDNPPTPINPTSNIQFKTVRSAVNYLNSQGVDDPNFGGTRTVRMEIDNGYIGETDTFITPITVLDYPRQSATRPVVLGIVTGRTDTIRIVSAINTGNIFNQSVIRYSGCRYFTIDGGNRNLTIMMPPAFTSSTNKVVDIISGVSTIMSSIPSTRFNSVRNCNLIGNSTTSGNLNFAAIYMGGLNTPSNSLAGLNNGNTFANNFIGAVQYGIYMRGGSVRSEMDNGNQVTGNSIGGNITPGGTSNTNYYGGINNAAGVYLLGQANVTISGNTIKNNISGFSAPRGIELATIPVVYPGLDSVVMITANTINSIASNVGGAAYGIYINFGNDSSNINRQIIMANNMISGISSFGTSSTGTNFSLNPYGVFLDATVNMRYFQSTNTAVALIFNSINLGSASTLTANNSLSAALGMTSQIRGGVFSKNNIYQNRLGGSVATTAYGVAIGGALNPFTFSDNNDYNASLTSPGVSASMGSNVSTSPILYNLWNEIMTFTNQDTLSITTQAPFTNDINLAIPATTSSNLYHAGISVTGFSTDIFGNGRFLIPSIGAHEFSGTYNDNIPPRLFNVSDPTICTDGPINVLFNIYDQQLSNDTLYYKINGGVLQSIQANFVSGTYRRYTIPAQSSGAIIEYRVSAKDYASNFGVFPINKIWDTISTGISNYPYFNGWEGVNNPAWTVQTLSGNGTWEINSTGSVANPPIGPRTNLKAASFKASSFSAGASARLISPCLNLSNMTSPTLRFYVSQNSDLPNKMDSIAVTLSAGGGYWTNPLKTVQRVNNNFSLPGYTMVEVCLAQYISSGIKIAIEGYAAGAGQNILIDDILIFDDVKNQAITPKTFNQCFSDSIRININNSDSRFSYRVVNRLNNQTIATKIGENANIYIGFPSPAVDTLRYFIEAKNLNSTAVNTGFGGGSVTCSNILPDSITAFINRFYNGPFVTAGLPFNGSYNNGDANSPDAVRIGDTITYKFVPPAFYTNADYGTLWSIPSVSAYTLSSNIPFTNYSFVAPSGGNAGYVRIIAPANMLDTSLVFNFRFRIIASSCDSTTQRILRITTPPTADFIFTPSSNVCALNDIQFDADGSVKPANNFPFSFGWFFGDGTTDFVSKPIKQYATAGTYIVRLILTDRYGLTSQKVQTITVLPSPAANFTTNVPCASDSTIFTPTAQPTGTTFLWTFPNVNIQRREIARYNFSKYDTAYIVSLRITNSSGCYASKTQSIYVFAKPTAAFTTAPHCLNTIVPIVNTSFIPVDSIGSTWYWGNGSTSLGRQPSYKYTASGTYSAVLKVTSSFGCQDSVVRTVTIYDRPFVNFTAVNACAGKTDQTTFNNTTAFSGGVQNVDYLWNFGDATSTSNTASPKHMYVSIGRPLITLLAIEKLNGCRDSISKFVQIYRKPISNFSSGNGVCVNNQLLTINQSFTVDQGIFTCLWDWDDGSTSTACSINHSYTTIGVKNIKLIITSFDGGCTDTSYHTVLVGNAPILAVDTQYMDTIVYPYCKNKVRFTASIANATSYVWTFGDRSNTKAYTQFYDMVYPEKGTFNVTCTVTDSNGCVIVQNLTHTVYCSVGIQEQLAQQFNLTAYPNPFANTANIGFELDKAASIRITVMDMLGRLVKVNEMGKIQSGKHHFMLDETNFGAAGTYLIKVEIDGVSIYKPLIKQ